MAENVKVAWRIRHISAAAFGDVKKNIVIRCFSKLQ
jgi:hypothetical protein